MNISIIYIIISLYISILYIYIYIHIYILPAYAGEVAKVFWTHLNAAISILGQKLFISLARTEVGMRMSEGH